MNYQKMVENIRRELKSYIEEHDLKALVLGVSGGIDSALICALARPVCDDLNIPLIGRSISIISNKPEEKRRAHKVGVSFCTDFKEVDLSPLFERMLDTYYSLEGLKDEGVGRKIREGNLKARIRMTYLYDICQANRGIVLSTDNLTELNLGFWTLMGDVGDYGMIQNLWKTEVYEMAKYLCGTYDHAGMLESLQSCIEATPTDGLGISNSDLEQIGVGTYEEADDRLMAYLNSGTEVEGCPVIDRHKRTEFKRLWPITIPRDKIVD
jgi:NAD+ synthase